MFNLKSKTKKWIVVLLIIIAAFGLARLYYRLTDDIRLANMVHQMPYHPEWEIPLLTPSEHAHFEAILSQPYHYIGKGAQSYAFASEDGLYVLKFFKFKHLKPSWFVDALPSIGPLKNYKDTQTARKQRKLEGVFKGYRLAYEVHKQPSGLLFIHLNPSNTINKSVVIIDKIGLKRTVDLDNFVFVLQEKGQTTRTVLKELLDKGDIDGVKAAISKIFTLYASEYAKGIYDHDHGVMCNTGFVGDRPIHLDVGKLMEAPEMKSPEFSNPDLEKVVVKIHDWLHMAYPQYAVPLDEYIETQISVLFGHPWTFKTSTIRGTQK